MKLNEKLPDSVTVDGRRFKCDFDFRNVLKMLEIMRRKDLLPDARDYLAAKCVISHKIPPKFVRSVYAEICNVLFPKPSESPENGQESHDRIMSYEQDAGLIRTAFRQVYGINLFVERLHWLEFSELLQNLPDGNRFEDVLSIRARPIPAPTKYNAETRSWLINAKHSVELKDLTEEEKAKSLNDKIGRVFNWLLGMAQKDGGNVGE